MRPVHLDLKGFASFRGFTVIDFTDAEYFALVGPTGSGKSTIIDAMTFALYGSAPRWGDERVVGDALAPTTPRATVRFVFDLAGARYVVAREVRRVGKTVQSKNLRLERYLEVGEGWTVDKPTHPIAAEGQVTDAVEQLLGLNFKQFCQCVVLPQGEFARFLKAKPSERRTILLQLLGAQQYDEIRLRASQRQNDAANQLAGVEEQLAALGDISDTALDCARGRHEHMAVLAQDVERRREDLRTARDAATAADTEVTTLERELALLTALELPPGVADLDERRRVATAAHRAAVRDEEEAAEAERLAAARLEAAGDPAPLRRIQDQRAELDALERRLPHLQAVALHAAEAEIAATNVWEQARAGLESARDGASTAETAYDELRARATHVAESLALVTLPGVPEEVRQITAEVEQAAERAGRADAALTAAQGAESEAARRLTSLPPLTELLEIQRALGDRQRVRDALTTAQRELDGAQASEASSTAALRQIRRELEGGREEHERQQTLHRAADLRPHLVVGEACPVCEQTVPVLPAALDAAALDAATIVLADISARFTAAEKAHQDATAAVQRAQARVGERQIELQRCEALSSDIGWPSSRAGAGGIDEAAADERIATLVAQRRQLDADHDTARRRVAEALAAARAATREHQTQRGRDERARRDLRSLRDRAMPLRPPDVEGLSLGDAWARMVQWASGEHDRLTGEHQELQSRLRDAADALAAAQTDLDHARTFETRTLEARSTATQDAATARTEHVRARATADELLMELAAAPSPAAVDSLLREYASAMEAITVARSATAHAREQLRSYGAALAELSEESRTANMALAGHRDSLVPLGAPALAGASVLSDWTTLLTWADGQAQARREALITARGGQADCVRLRDDLVAALSDAVTAAGLALDPGDILETAVVAVDRAVHAALSTVEDLQRRRRRAGELTARTAALRAERDVARRLHDLLRSEQFPRWLESAALTALVDDASKTLMTLTAGQYELDFDGRNEFEVVDHGDADQSRSIKTLSGGELFQASLALALALSAHISHMAVGRSAHLDSIFLDEGFGSLDPDTLETVAETLESLANTDRMVGVITHVASLAERVPVRFLVSRDAAGSRVERDGPA